MSLLTPDLGLLFWMLLSFGIVFFVLAKFGFPVIVKMVDKRKEYIENSLEAAKEANRQLASIKTEGEKILAEAREEQLRLMKDAEEIRNKMIADAKQQAQVEAEKVMQNAQSLILKEKEDAIKDIKHQVAALSVEIAEKVLRKDLENKSAQMELIDKLLNEAKN